MRTPRNAPYTEDFIIQAWERAHVVVDVVGYYAPPLDLQRSEPECHSSYLMGPTQIGPRLRTVTVAPACEVGFTRFGGPCDRTLR